MTSSNTLFWLIRAAYTRHQLKSPNAAGDGVSLSSDSKAQPRKLGSNELRPVHKEPGPDKSVSFNKSFFMIKPPK